MLVCHSVDLFCSSVELFVGFFFFECLKIVLEATPYSAPTKAYPIELPSSSSYNCFLRRKVALGSRNPVG